jgi:hypothetical protein
MEHGCQFLGEFLRVVWQSRNTKLLILFPVPKATITASAFSIDFFKSGLFVALPFKVVKFTFVKLISERDKVVTV